MPTKLLTIVGSTRPGRMAPIIARWFHELAGEDERFDAEYVDLVDFALPLFDEPQHPRLGQYEHEHTKAWSAKIASGDAFVFVAPEYNHGPSPALLNAIDYLSLEWARKPAAFVSYGGVAAGARSVQMLKPILSALEVVPIQPSVAIPMFPNFIKEGNFEPTEPLVAAAGDVLDHLQQWSTALRTLRGT